MPQRCRLASRDVEKRHENSRRRTSDPSAHVPRALPRRGQMRSGILHASEHPARRDCA
jgi:hypothetical protein